MFDGLISQHFGMPESSKSLVAGNRVLSEEFGAILRNLLKRFSANIGESVETHSRERLVTPTCVQLSRNRC